jgi:membrane-bound metal-dependent hydrolase YbcI (DUF457 family)
MLVFAHLCIGAIAGLFFARLTGYRYMVLVGMLGSILPDLVDKPLEVLGLGDILGYEVLILHTLLALVILSMAMLLAHRFLPPPLPAVMALIVLVAGLHQVMDLAWMAPGRWLYPFLGPIPQSCSCLTPELMEEAGGLALEVPAGFVWTTILEELLSTSEWVFAGVTALILLAPRLGERAIRWGAVLLGALSLWTLVSFATLAGIPVPVIDDGHRIEELLLVVSAGGALALWYYDRGEREGRDRGGGTGGPPP